MPVWESLFRILGGGAFVLLGRWTYRHPKRVFPQWVFSKPDTPTLMQFVRGWSILVIFLGWTSILAAVLGFVVPAGVAFFAALVAAGFGVLYRRISVPRAEV